MIFHIVSRSEWNLARTRGDYRPPSLEADGFIHCSTGAQLAATADLFYRGQRDLLVLRIDPARLTSRLVFEAPADAAEARPHARFPHVYGPLNLDAVIDAIEFPCAADGSFELPAALADSTQS